MTEESIEDKRYYPAYRSDINPIQALILGIKNVRDTIIPVATLPYLINCILLAKMAKMAKEEEEKKSKKQ